MSAREDLIDEVTWSLNQGDWPYQGDAYAYAVKMVDAFAHELAEKIREAEVDEEDPQIYYGRWGVGMRMAADLIDPGLNND